MILKSKQSGKGAISKVLIYLLLVIIVLGGGSFYAWHWFSGGKAKKVNVIRVPVVRGTFIHEIVGKGSAESAKNVDIICQVEGQSTIVELIPEGETVEEGTVLVRLDTESIDDKVNSQQIKYNSSTATVASAQAKLRTAELSLEEYIEGTFEQSWATIENNIYANRETQKQSADNVRYSERLVQLSYSTTMQLEIDRVTEQKAINSVRSSLLEQLVLLKYTSEKKITELMSDIETARANLDSETYSNKLDKDRLVHYTEQQQFCTIKAPQAGQVVYANQDSRPGRSESEMIKDGATVRKGQILIRLPDPSQMQVRAMINESNISFIKNGMKVILGFDAITNKKYEGEVIKVNRYPEIVWMSSAKDYVTLIKIQDNASDIRTGLTAEVRIIANKLDDVLMIPVHSVVEFEGKTFCLTYHEGTWGYKEVLLGASNDKEIIILKGLEENEEIVAGARQYKDNVELPGETVPSIYEEKNALTSTDKEKSTVQGEKPKRVKPEGMPDGFKMPEGPNGQMPEGMQGQMPQGPNGQMPEGMQGQMPQGPNGQMPEGMQGQMPEGARAQMRANRSGGQGRKQGGQGRMPGMAGGQGGMPGMAGGQGGMTGMAGGQGGMPGAAGGQGGMPGAAGGQDGMPGMAGGQGGMPGAAGGQGGMPGAAGGQGGMPGMAGGQGGMPGMGQNSSVQKAKEITDSDIDVEEVKKKLQRIKPLEKYFELTAMEFCRTLDEDHNKVITRKEVKEKAAELDNFYDEWDRNKDGEWSQTDFVIGFCSSRIYYEKMKALYQAEEMVDKGKDHSRGISYWLDNNAEEIFAKYDADKDGFIVLNEIKSEHQEPLKEMFSLFDTDLDEKISLAEFKTGIDGLKARMNQQKPLGSEEHPKGPGNHGSNSKANRSAPPIEGQAKPAVEVKTEPKQESESIKPKEVSQARKPGKLQSAQKPTVTEVKTEKAPAAKEK